MYICVHMYMYMYVYIYITHTRIYSMFPCVFFWDTHVVLVLLNADHYLYLQIKK